MALVNQVDKKVRMDNWNIIKYQLLTHCYLNNLLVSDAELNCLTYLALEGSQELTSFCNKASDKKIFSSAQSVRNCLRRAEIKNLIVKEGKNKKKIFIHPDIKLQTEGSILLNFKFLSVATS